MNRSTYCSIFLLLFSCACFTYSNLIFPKCQDIVRVVDGKPACEFCYTKRMNEQCKEHCKESGCKDPTYADCNDIDPCVAVEKANEKFRACCEKREVKETCWPKCRYDVKKQELQDAILGGLCPLRDMHDYLMCASNERNNTYCCDKLHVLDGERAELCEPFCNPESENWPTKAEGKYLRCVPQFDSIMKCHLASTRL